MNFLKIGQIVNTHGIKGELKIYPYTDNIENMRKLKKLYLDPELKSEYIVKNVKILKNMLILKLENIDTCDQAEAFIKKYIYIEKEEIIEEDTYYVDDLIDLDVFTIDDSKDTSKATYFGKLVYVYNTGANDIYEIQTANENIYIPAIKDVIVKIDLKERKVYIKLMEGLI